MFLNASEEPLLKHTMLRKYKNIISKITDHLCDLHLLLEHIVVCSMTHA
jgi:hypothetical protein